MASGRLGGCKIAVRSAASTARDWLQALPCEADGLRLRTLRLTDLSDFLGWRSDPDLAHFQGWMPMDSATAQAFLQAQARASPQPAGTQRQIGVADAVSDCVLGDLGICLFLDVREAELSISVAPAAQGRGIARWAVSTLCALLVAHAGVERIRAAADLRNLHSLRMLEAAGMSRCGRHSVVSKGRGLRRAGVRARAPGHGRLRYLSAQFMRPR